jgi:hypothetical protein
VDTAPIARPVEPVALLGKLQCAARAARASLQTLIGWAYQEEPAAVGPLTRVQEARATREYAVRFFRTDPRFAADLCAAADRHERGDSA